MRINELKNFKDRDTDDLEVLVGVRAELKLLATSFDELNMETPEWVLNAIVNVEDKVKSLMKAERLAALRKLELKRAALATPDEKRKALDDEIATLKGQM